MDDPVSVTLESSPYGMELFGALPPPGVGAEAGLCVEGLFLELLYPFPYGPLISRSISRPKLLFFSFTIFRGMVPASVRSES